MLIQSYETYRALRPPKPTYRQFITDNAPTAEPAREWWNNRLRLLQLIGGSHGDSGAVTSERKEEERYFSQLAERLREFSAELVPEMILLNGREGKHDEALKLLVHGLGDYDTAIRYCLLGGSASLFHPSGGGGSGANSQGDQQQQPPTPPYPPPGKIALQTSLFRALLRESLQIADLSERLERTAELLERFAAWFDVAEVLSLIPDGWSVDLVSGFLVHALRRLVRERQESVVVKGLAGAQNLRCAASWGEKMREVRGTVVKEVDEREDAGDRVVGTG
ncbi:hypothetical protein KC343_g19936 [Hortaea werneckii]|nr:hypothetical protein KC352_g37225 [Hortaea werneckii]KAI7530856.1 hypothetical protein KC317_g19943 [Hortaea werneckii]KAI7575813.1 hypothetical protein KC346_g19883 [Hortaea werneckii]KAI7583775.1 hypothetical protein KC343_g19936 [Hortaea werneckii]KAI7615869.1 hypothetical protein KC319_g19602 [Hortaea werneckii]